MTQLTNHCHRYIQTKNNRSQTQSTKNKNKKIKTKSGKKLNQVGRGIELGTGAASE
jgi:hypothetical protein